MTKSEERAEGIDGKRPESAAIEHPSYYNQGIEVIDFVDSYGLNFNLGNVVKYVVRAGHKPGEEAVEALRSPFDERIKFVFRNRRARHSI